MALHVTSHDSLLNFDSYKPVFTIPPPTAPVYSVSHFVIAEFFVVSTIGYLCPGTESEHIQPGSRVELPLWMAQSLCSRRRHIATVEVPRSYRSGHRKILDADAAVVDLHKLCPYYYSVGTRLLAFDLTESADIARQMLLVLCFIFLLYCLLICICYFCHSSTLCLEKSNPLHDVR